jgi:hypothetical protein
MADQRRVSSLNIAEHRFDTNHNPVILNEVKDLRSGTRLKLETQVLRIRCASLRMTALVGREARI